jgi:polyisoprenoid-binding protein YceI
MTAPQPSSRRMPLLAIAALAVLVAAAAGLWYLFFRPAGPAPVSLGTLPPIAASTGPSASADVATGASQAPSSDPGRGSTGLDGTWSVDQGVGSFDDFSGTFVGYRVREELASVGATEAVGRTPDVTGSMTIDGTTITAVDLTADLTTLQSDERNRDRQLARQGLETGQFPTATFALTQPIELGSIPANGETIDATATGDLTLHGETKRVDVPVQARLQDGVITVAGSLPVLFSDYGMTPPSAMIVLSVEDNGVMEFQVHFTQAQGSDVSQDPLL